MLTRQIQINCRFLCTVFPTPKPTVSESCCSWATTGWECKKVTHHSQQRIVDARCKAPLSSNCVLFPPQSFAVVCASRESVFKVPARRFDVACPHNILLSLVLQFFRTITPNLPIIVYDDVVEHFINLLLCVVVTIVVHVKKSGMLSRNWSIVLVASIGVNHQNKKLVVEARIVC